MLTNGNQTAIFQVLANNVTGNVSTEDMIRQVLTGNTPGNVSTQDLIKQVYLFSRQPEFEGKIVFLEDYDMDMARHLVSGCDVPQLPQLPIVKSEETEHREDLVVDRR